MCDISSADLPWHRSSCRSYLTTTISTRRLAARVGTEAGKRLERAIADHFEARRSGAPGRQVFHDRLCPSLGESQVGFARAHRVSVPLNPELLSCQRRSRERGQELVSLAAPGVGQFGRAGDERHPEIGAPPY